MIKNNSIIIQHFIKSEIWKKISARKSVNFLLFIYADIALLDDITLFLS